MNKKIAVLDYGLGNIRSVSNALIVNGAEPIITSNKSEIFAADGLIVPGVGAFPHAAENLIKTGLNDVVKTYAQIGKPVLGICLGMQILFERGYEYEETPGLNLIPGEIEKISITSSETRLPHIKWATVKVNYKNTKMFNNISEDNIRFYFVHSFAATRVPNDFLAATVVYDGSQIVAAVERDNIWGTQFHPEKSGKQGLQLIKNFINNC